MNKSALAKKCAQVEDFALSTTKTKAGPMSSTKDKAPGFAVSVDVNTYAEISTSSSVHSAYAAWARTFATNVSRLNVAPLIVSR